MTRCGRVFCHAIYRSPKSLAMTNSRWICPKIDLDPSGIDPRSAVPVYPKTRAELRFYTTSTQSRLSASWIESPVIGRSPKSE